MKPNTMTSAIIVTALLFTACAEPANNDPADPTTNTDQNATSGGANNGPLAAVTAERQKVAEELKDLRGDVEERLVDVNNKLARTDLDKATRKAVEEERDTLIGLRERIDGSLRQVEGADETTWQSVKEGVRNTLTDVKDWFKRQAEKVDKETKADADDDGH